MKASLCIITGGSSGIGKATAQRCAGMGMSVAIVARGRQRGKAAQAEIQAASGNPDVDLLLADLSSQAEVHRLAEEFRPRYTNLHVLINRGSTLSRSAPSPHRRHRTTRTRPDGSGRRVHS